MRHIIIYGMANLVDYVNWRGDLSFEQDPFNEVDALFFSCISYVDFSGIVTEGTSISLSDASDLFFQIHTQEERDADKSFIRFAYHLMKKAAYVPRYANVILSDYVDHTDPANLIQFAVVSVRYAPSEVFIAFRGTDDTLVGWKEDFYLSYAQISSEAESLEYLNSVQSGRLDRIRMGGHSKGGHLAIFSAMETDKEIQDRIDGIYDFDGPGFNDEVKETDKFKNIGSKIFRVIPENSVIGRLLSDTAVPLVVSSTEKGIMQHDPLSWGIEGKKFVAMEKTSVASDVFDEILTQWITEMKQDEKKQFIDDLFSVLEASGETNVSQISTVSLVEVKAMLDRMHALRRDSQAVIRKLLRLFIDNWGDVLLARSRNNREEITTPLRKLIEAKKV